MIVCFYVLPSAQVIRQWHFEKCFFLVLCGFNRWLESDIMCVFYVLANYLGCYVLFTVFVVIRCELEN